MYVIRQILRSYDQQKCLKKLHQLLNEQCHSDNVVLYLRLITSAQFIERADFYNKIIGGNSSIEQFCHREVESMYRESGRLHIIGECCVDTSFKCIYSSVCINLK